jgi:hypothetical protein
VVRCCGDSHGVNLFINFVRHHWSSTSSTSSSEGWSITFACNFWKAIADEVLVKPHEALLQLRLDWFVMITLFIVNCMKSLSLNLAACILVIQVSFLLHGPTTRWFFIGLSSRQASR